MKSNDLVDAMNALNVVRARRKEIAQINRVIVSENPTKIHFRITNDNGDSFHIEDAMYFLSIIREKFTAEIDANLEVLEMLGIDVEPDDEDENDTDEE